jgi:hypothetical protein
LLEELHAVGRHDRHELQLDAQPLGDVRGEIGLDADDRAGGIAETIRLVIGLDADDQRAAFLDIVERILRAGGHRYQCSNNRNQAEIN